MRSATRVIALDRREHEALLAVRFPELVRSVTYWDVQDVEFVSPEEALPAIDYKVVDLVRTLAKAGRP